MAIQLVASDGEAAHILCHVFLHHANFLVCGAAEGRPIVAADTPCAYEQSKALYLGVRQCVELSTLER